MDRRVVLWDWNGTLLDDVQFAIDVRNRVFPRFGLPKIKDRETYYDQFTFPVKLYYQRAGVPDETFETVANAWMDEYVAGCHAVPLFGDAADALDRFAREGFTQVILSASEEETLHRQLAYAGILDRFDAVLGLSHIYATDKTRLAEDYLSGTGIDPASCVLLGDTAHDAAVAGSLGIGCVLIARGHMSERRLRETNYPVCASLTEAARLVIGRKTERV
jgi:phosphoglycolate phosphatase